VLTKTSLALFLGLKSYNISLKHSICALCFSKVIRQNAGVVEDVYSTKVTYVLCSHQDGDYYKTSLEQGKRLVTRYWLSDVTFNKKLIAPRTPLHLPVPLKRESCDGMVSMLPEYQLDET
jgi:hypothetical protein